MAPRLRMNNAKAGRKRGRKRSCRLSTNAVQVVHHSYITVILMQEIQGGRSRGHLFYPLVSFHCCETERLYSRSVFAFNFLLQQFVDDSELSRINEGDLKGKSVKIRKGHNICYIGCPRLPVPILHSTRLLRPFRHFSVSPPSVVFHPSLA